MAREQPQINIRLPAELKDCLDSAATKNRRSLTAEVVARLERSFAATDEESHLRQLLEQSRTLAADQRAELLQNDADAGKQQLYILLDTNGYVVSWAEIQAILAALRKAGNFNPAEMHTEIITPDLESSTRRTEQATALARKLRAGGKSRAIKPDDAQD